MDQRQGQGECETRMVLVGGGRWGGQSGPETQALSTGLCPSLPQTSSRRRRRQVCSLLFCEFQEHTPC